jgi:putative Mn2+ efflux pump MntP
MKKINYVHGAIIALFFGVFQSLMPLIGWLVGSRFSSYITQFDHWIAFILLVLIGGNMIRESLQEDEEEEEQEDRLDYKELFLLAIATSIDALAVGITFAFLQVEIISSVLLIGIITFVISFAGVIIGNIFGSRFKNKAEILGGIILILIGIKILLEHLNIL